MAMNNAFRSCASRLVSTASVLPKSANREFHSTVAKRMGGGHGHGYEYEHTKHMYNLDRMKGQAVKMSLFVFTLVGMGVTLPVLIVNFQQKKTKSA